MPMYDKSPSKKNLTIHMKGSSEMFRLRFIPSLLSRLSEENNAQHDRLLFFNKP